MKLSEIAKYIADNYPESNIAYNNDVINNGYGLWMNYLNQNVR